MEICNPKMMMMMINNNKDRTHVDHRLQQFVENRSQIQEDSSTVVEAGSLKSRCPQGHTPLQAPWIICFCFVLFSLPLSSFSWLQALLGLRCIPQISGFLVNSRFLLLGMFSVYLS